MERLNENEVLRRPDFVTNYPEYRNFLIGMAERDVQQRLMLRRLAVEQLKEEANPEVQARLVDLITQYADTAGWWRPRDSRAYRGDFKESIIEQETRVSQLDNYLVHVRSLVDREEDEKSLWMLSRRETLYDFPGRRNLSLRDDWHDVYLNFVLATAIGGTGVQHNIVDEWSEGFLSFVLSEQGAKSFILEQCRESYLQGNISPPDFQRVFKSLAQRHISPDALTAVHAFNAYTQVWEDYRDEVYRWIEGQRINPKTTEVDRYNMLNLKVLVALAERDIRLESIADFGCGPLLSPLNHFVTLLQRAGIGEELEQVTAYDLFALENIPPIGGGPFPETKLLDVDYRQQDITEGEFISEEEPKVDLAMSLNVSTHFYSDKRVRGLEGMLRRARRAVLIAGGIYGRHYFDEENPEQLLPRSWKGGKANGWLFLRNESGGLDFIPMNYG